MAAAIRTLAGRTLFITGASRGIGLNIALRAAADGANIVVAAKTTEPKPNLPGTIYTAAKEIEAAGGQCLPCVVDVRDEDQVAAAFKEAHAKFGGIDILVNNASAIHLIGTEATSTTDYDLMHQVNIRGAFLCSKYAIPYLRKASNPHILNMSPPLNMSTKWFKDDLAFTMAKYGMSSCVFGLAEELRPDNIAVNALWPQTAIYTPASVRLGNTESVKNIRRHPEIMSDAAHIILTRDSKAATGNFYIDEDILQEKGVTNFDKYTYVPELGPDMFLEDKEPEVTGEQIKQVGGMSPTQHSSTSPPASGLIDMFSMITEAITEDVINQVGEVFAFDFEEDGKWYLDLKNGTGSAGKGEARLGEVDCTLTLDVDTFTKMFKGTLDPANAFMTGKISVEGDVLLAMKLETFIRKIQASKA